VLPLIRVSALTNPPCAHPGSPHVNIASLPGFPSFSSFLFLLLLFLLPRGVPPLRGHVSERASPTASLPDSIVGAVRSFLSKFPSLSYRFWEALSSAVPRQRVSIPSWRLRSGLHPSLVIWLLGIKLRPSLSRRRYYLRKLLGMPLWDDIIIKSWGIGFSGVTAASVFDFNFFLPCVVHPRIPEVFLAIIDVRGRRFARDSLTSLSSLYQFFSWCLFQCPFSEAAHHSITLRWLLLCTR